MKGKKVFIEICLDKGKTKKELSAITSAITMIKGVTYVMTAPYEKVKDEDTTGWIEYEVV